MKRVLGAAVIVALMLAATTGAFALDKVEFGKDFLRCYVEGGAPQMERANGIIVQAVDDPQKMDAIMEAVVRYGKTIDAKNLDLALKAISIRQNQKLIQLLGGKK